MMTAPELGAAGGRPSWHEYFMLMAKMVSTRSTCSSRPTGAVIVKDKQILCTGYNGAVPGAPHCTDMREPDGGPFCFRRHVNAPDVDKYNFCRSSHAEANAVAQAARFGVALAGATVYCTLAPCYVCLKLLVTAGVRRIYYEAAYESASPERDEFWKKAVRDSGVEVFEQVVIQAEMLDQAKSALEFPTSRRRLAPTAFLPDDMSTYEPDR